MLGSSPRVNGGNQGFCQFDIATTMLLASNRRSRAVTTNWPPCLERQFTLTPNQIGRSKTRSVGLQVVGHLVLRGKRVGLGREGQAREPIEGAGVNKRSNSQRFRFPSIGEPSAPREKRNNGLYLSLFLRSHDSSFCFDWRSGAAERGV